MSDHNQNLINNKQDTLVSLDKNTNSKNIIFLVENIIIILENEYKNNNNNKLIKNYIYSFRGVSESICYSPPESLQYNEIDIYNLLVSFDIKYSSKTGAKQELRKLWNEYKL